MKFEINWAAKIHPTSNFDTIKTMQQSGGRLRKWMVDTKPGKEDEPNMCTLPMVGPQFGPQIIEKLSEHVQIICYRFVDKIKGN